MGQDDRPDDRAVREFTVDAVTKVRSTFTMSTGKLRRLAWDEYPADVLR